MAWEACLWARLGFAEETWKSLLRLLGEYTAPNLMGLHPALGPTGWKGCETCFSESAPFRDEEEEGRRVAEGEREKSRKFSEEEMGHKRGFIDEFGGVVSE